MAPQTYPTSRTAPAHEANRRKNALRAIDDPAKLSRAARIVRAALERRRLTLDEVIPLAGGDDDEAA